MRFAVLHQDLEWAERRIHSRLEEAGHEAVLVDVREADEFDFAPFDTVLNRVYASVANRNWRDNVRALALLERLEEQGIRCVNSHACTVADYYKHRAARVMHEAGVATAPSILIEQMSDYHRQAEEVARWGYPLVIKRNMGGRAFDICKAADETEARDRLEHLFSPGYLEGYAGGIIIQPYLQSVRPYDMRILVVANEPVYGLSRSLVAMRPGEGPWLGSSQWGSKLSPYEASEQEIDIAKRASAAIDAVVNEVDLLETDEGYVVMENNPTPSYRENSTYLDRLVEAMLIAVT